MTIKTLCLISLFVLIGCGPRVLVKKETKESHPPLPDNTEVIILGIAENVPANGKKIGEGYFGDTGFTISCNYDKMMGIAKMNALSLGANLIKIVEHNTPDIMSSCHRIRVHYYFVSEKYDQQDLRIQDSTSHVAVNLNKVTSGNNNEQQAYSKPKNNIAIGYQIGGHTLIGISHEIRMSDVFGVHFGGGFAGFSSGVRFHTNHETLSSYYDLNFKDGGFGLVGSIAFQYGGTWKMSGDQGFRYEIGLQKVVYVDKEFKDKLFKDNKVPPVMLAVGVGWAW